MRQARKQPAGTLSAAAMEAELDRIGSLSFDEMRVLWRTMTQQNAPKVLSRDLIARMLAYRIQEQALGKIKRSASPATRFIGTIRAVAMTSSALIGFGSVIFSYPCCANVGIASPSV
jgi:Protein of unknown function (DUF2924)